MVQLASAIAVYCMKLACSKQVVLIFQTVAAKVSLAQTLP